MANLNILINRAKKNLYDKSFEYQKYLKNFNKILQLNEIVKKQDLDFNKKDISKIDTKNKNSSNETNNNNNNKSSISSFEEKIVNIFARGNLNYGGGGENALNSNNSKKEIEITKLPENILKEIETNWEPSAKFSKEENFDLYYLSKGRIHFDEKKQKIVYKIIEPDLSLVDKENIAIIKRHFTLIFENISKDNEFKENKDLISKYVTKISKKYIAKITDEEIEKYCYYIVRDFLGLEQIEPLMHDPFIEDISCDGLDVPIYVNHLKYGAIEVNRCFDDLEILNQYIIKLAQKCEQDITIGNPILQGSLPNGSRVEAIYGKEISQKGSSFTIRKFREKPFTPIHLLKHGSVPSLVLAYLWLIVENRKSILISGGTASGKTTFLNALSLFVPPSAKIVSIEDTPEINLPHEHWLAMVTKESGKSTDITMFDLLKASLRERPDFIVVGEIRGEEANVLFQGMASGHAGMGTVHANRFEDLVNRMTIAPISLPKQLLGEIDLIVFLGQVIVKKRSIRRVTSMVEIQEYDLKENDFIKNEFCSFKHYEDKFEIKDESILINKLIKLRGGGEKNIWTEIEKRRRILDLMDKKNLTEFAEVSNIFDYFYKNPKSIFDYIRNYKK